MPRAKKLTTVTAFTDTGNVKAHRRKITDLIPDEQNANEHTERGMALLDDSVTEDGLGRGVLLDTHDRIIAGNATVETAVANGYEDVIVVETDGKTLVATKRVDVEVDSAQGRRMAIRDNRVAQANLQWDADALIAASEAGVSLEKMWFDDELIEVLHIGGETTPPGAARPFTDKDFQQNPFVQFHFGQHHGQVSKEVYEAFVKEYDRIKAQTGAVVMSDILKTWFVK